MQHPIAYLTVDDGPGPHFRQKVDIHVKLNAPAIFFCTGKNLQQRPDDALHALDSGFEIGNHSFNHPHFSSLSIKEAEFEIEQTEKLIQKLYQQAGRRAQLLFRFPYGDRGANRSHIAAMQSILTKRGYSQPNFKGIDTSTLPTGCDVGWTFGFADWQYDGTEGSRLKLFERLGAIAQHSPEDLPNNHVVLMHDHENTTLCYANFIRRIKSAGFQIALP